MRLLLLDINPILCAAWQRAFADAGDVQIVNSSFENLIGTYDCLVSPANSFGLMDGGMDAAITSFFGVHLEERVQKQIWQRFRGEQPVGTCLIVPTNHAKCPYLAHCPTMPVPMDVSDTSNAYASCLAALTTAESAGIRTLACPGLGTMVGKMPPEVAAKQMRYAFDLWKRSFQRPAWPSVTQHLWQASGRSRRDYLLRELVRRNPGDLGRLHDSHH